LIEFDGVRRVVICDRRALEHLADSGDPAGEPPVPDLAKLKPRRVRPIRPRDIAAYAPAEYARRVVRSEHEC
jgi:hypothetical protein